MTDWMSTDSAPKDGTKIRILVRHQNWEYAPDEDKHMWEEDCPAKWIDHNGGGFPWYGLCGSPIAWMPLKESQS